MALRVGADEIEPHQLAEDRLPLGLRAGAAHAEGRQPVVAAGADPVGRLAAQDGDQVLAPEALAGPEHRREGHARRLGAVEDLRPVAAEVAGAARLDERLIGRGQQDEPGIGLEIELLVDVDHQRPARDRPCVRRRVDQRGGPSPRLQAERRDAGQAGDLVAPGAGGVDQNPALERFRPGRYDPGIAVATEHAFLGADPQTLAMAHHRLHLLARRQRNIADDNGAGITARQRCHACLEGAEQEPITICGKGLNFVTVPILHLGGRAVAVDGPTIEAVGGAQPKPGAVLQGGLYLHPAELIER